MAGILDMMGYIQDQGDKGRAQGQQSRLGSLYSQAMTASPDQRAPLLAQMAQVSPDAANAAQKNFASGDESATKDMLQSLSMATAAWKAGNKDLAQGFYSRAAPHLASVSGGRPLPPQMDDAAAAAFDKIIASAGSATGTHVTSKYVTDSGDVVALMSDGTRVLTGDKADPRTQFRDQPGVAPGIITMSGANRGQVSPISDAQGQQQGAPMQGAPMQGQPMQQPQGMSQVQYATSDGSSIPPGEQAAAQAAFAASAQGKDFNITVPVGGGPMQGAPQGQLPPRLDYQNGGQQGGPAAMRPAPTGAVGDVSKRQNDLQDMRAAGIQITPEQQTAYITTGKMPDSASGGTNANPLAGLSPSDAEMVRRLSRYETLPSSLGRANNRADLIGRAAMLNPDYNEASAKEAYTYKTDLGRSSATSLGGQATAVNTALHHLGTMMKINAKLQTGSFPLINSGLNAANYHGGASELTQWNQAKIFVSEEMAKLVKGGVATEGEMKDIMQAMDANGSPRQRNDAISGAAQFLYGRVSALDERGKDVLGGMWPGTSLMTPEAQKILGAAYKMGGHIAPEFLPPRGTKPGQRQAPKPAAQGGHVDDLLSKYGVK